MICDIKKKLLDKLNSAYDLNSKKCGSDIELFELLESTIRESEVGISDEEVERLLWKYNLSERMNSIE